MVKNKSFPEVLAAHPLIAILRGVTPDEIPALADTLYANNFRILEVPLNSPQALESIAILARHLPDCLIGAGTVLTTVEVDQVQEAGGQLIVSPNCDPDVIMSSCAKGMISLPGVATPTEAFAALKAGATGLKLFPAEIISPDAVRAFRAVLPKQARLVAVGGITPDRMAAYSAAGINGFGLGSALYRAGLPAAQTFSSARAFQLAAASLNNL